MQAFVSDTRSPAKPWFRRTMLTAAMWMWLAAPDASAAGPQRIVSLNVCTDQILVELVGRDRIAGVTHLAADATISAAADRLAGLPVTHGGAEDVLSRDPDLVIAGAYTTPATVDLLRRLGRRVLVVPLPQNLAGVRAAIAEIAAGVGEPEAGAKLVGDLDARIARVRVESDASKERPTALVYQVNNYVVGAGSVLDEALDIAGFRNGGRQMRTFASGQTDLEQLLSAPPDLLVLATSSDAYATVVGDNLRHPALRTLMRQIPSIVLPWPLWLCATQHIATAIERLALARGALSAGRATRRPPS